MSLDNALAEVVRVVPDCIAAGFVDMSTGMILGIKTVDSHPQEVIDVLAAATGDLFQGTNVVTIEKLFKRTRGVPENDDSHYFNEFIALSQNLIHVFIRGKNDANTALVTVNRIGANLGMVLSKSRQSLAEVEKQA
jgi:hypothetical protein